MSAQLQRFQVVLPLPPRGCSPNGRLHYLAKAKATKQARRAAWYWFRRELPQGWRQRPVRLEVIYHCPRGAFGYCPRDTQNAIAALKASIDGMVDAKVIPDDNGQWLSWGRVQLTRHGDMKPGVYVTVVAEAAADEERGAEHGSEPCPT